MKLRILFLPVIFSLFLTQAHAQNTEIEAIRAYYKEVNEGIPQDEDNSDGGWSKLTITRSVVVPAIGPQQYTIIFYFDPGCYEEPCEGESGKKEPATVKKIIVKYNVAASAEYYEEYLVKNDEVIFYYSRQTGYTNEEVRHYYKKNKLLKVKTTTYDTPDMDKVMEEYESNTVTEVKSGLPGMEYIKIFNDLTSHIQKELR